MSEKASFMRKDLIRVAQAALAVALYRLPASAYEWSGAAGDGQWDTPGNWVGNSVPKRGGDVTFPAGKGRTIMLPAESVKLFGVTKLYDHYVFKAPKPATYEYVFGNLMQVHEGASLTLEDGTFRYDTDRDSTTWAGDITLINSTFNTKRLQIDGITCTLKDSVWITTSNLLLRESDAERPTLLVLDNSQIQCAIFPGGTSYRGGAIILKGRRPQLLVGTLQGGDAANGTPYVSVLFDIPAGGYEGIPITARSGNGFPVNGLLHFAIDPGSEVFDSDFEGIVPLAAFRAKNDNDTTYRGIRIGSATMGVVCDPMDETAVASIRQNGGDFVGYRFSTQLAASPEDPVLAKGELPILPDDYWSDTRTKDRDNLCGVFVKGSAGSGEPMPPSIRAASLSADIDGTVTIMLSGRDLNGATATLALAEKSGGQWTEKSGIIGEKRVTLTGFPLTYSIYKLRVKATNGVGSCEWFELEDLVLKDESGLSAVKLTANQRKVIVTGTVDPIGAGESKVYVAWSVNGATYVHTNLVATVSASSPVADWAWTNRVDRFGDVFYCKAFVVNGGEYASGPWTTEEVGLNVTTADTATYYWQQHPTTGDWDGAWTEAAHWTADTEDCGDYPTQIGDKATASFANASGCAVTVRMPVGEVTIKSIVAGAANVTNRLVGAADGSSTLTFKGSTPDFGSASAGLHMVFERMKVNVSASVSFSGNNQTLEFKDAELVLSGSNRIDLGGSSGVRNSTLIVDNSTLTANSDKNYTGIYLGQNEKAAGPCTLIVRGESPRLNLSVLSTRLSTNTHDDETCARVVFEIPFRGYPSAPIVGNDDGKTQLDSYNGTSTRGKRLFFLIDRASPALMRGSGRWLEYELVDWPNGMYTEGPIVLDPGDVTPSGALRANSHVKPMVYDDDEKPTKILVEVLGRSGSTFMVR